MNPKKTAGEWGAASPPSLALLAALSTPFPAAAQAYLRINQLGYETGQTAESYLVTPTADAGARFNIVDSSGRIVVSGKAGSSTGTWGVFTVYPLTFTVTTPGQYAIQVTGTVQATSPVFTVGSPALLYATALSNALGFYRNERDGPDFVPSALRTASAHLNDASAIAYETPPLAHGVIQGDLVPTGAVIDASGGWWDAGDYLKFVETESYVVAMMLTGVRDFPSQMGAGSAADFADESKFGLSWLLKMWDDPSRTLYYEVGIGIDFQGKHTLSDHDIWRLPQRDDTLGHGAARYAYIEHRPVFAAGPAGSKISPNMAGRLAAAFALGFVQYRASDSAFARHCLFAAEHVLDLADTNPHRLLTALPYGFYPEVEWRDDLEWGATELDIALALAGKDLPAGLPHSDPAYYLRLAASFAAAYIGGQNDAADQLNLYDVSGIAHFDLTRAIDLAGRPAGLAVSQAQLLADLQKQLTGAEQQAQTDPFRFGFIWGTYDTTSHGAGLSVVADEFAYLGGQGIPPGRATDWLGNIMGANIWGLSLIVGDGANFPKCLQHQVANLIGSLDSGAPVLNGAAVEGPNAASAVVRGTIDHLRPCPANGQDEYKVFTGNGARFKDDARNYPNTEPAIDLTASSPLMFAWRIAGAPRSLAEAASPLR